MDSTNTEVAVHLMSQALELCCESNSLSEDSSKSSSSSCRLLFEICVAFDECQSLNECSKELCEVLSKFDASSEPLDVFQLVDLTWDSKVTFHRLKSSVLSRAAIWLNALRFHLIRDLSPDAKHWMEEVLPLMRGKTFSNYQQQQQRSRQICSIEDQQTRVTKLVELLRKAASTPAGSTERTNQLQFIVDEYSSYGCTEFNPLDDSLTIRRSITSVLSTLIPCFESFSPNPHQLMAAMDGCLSNLVATNDQNPSIPFHLCSLLIACLVHCLSLPSQSNIFTEESQLIASLIELRNAQLPGAVVLKSTTTNTLTRQQFQELLKEISA